MDPSIERIEAATADASPDVRAAFERLQAASADADKDAARGSLMSERVSCSVDDNLKIRFLPPGFDPHRDKAVTVGALRIELARIEAQIHLPKPQTDRVMVDLAKKKSVLEQAVANFQPSDPFSPTTRGARKSKREAKRFRRKIDRARPKPTNC
jgi:hypothetical protein